MFDFIRRRQRDSKSTKEKLKQAAQAVRDMNRNYWDMKRDNTINADDYFIAKPIMRQLPEEELVKKLPKNQAM